MGGNLTLKLAGEIRNTQPALRGVAAVSPNIQPALCVQALQRPTNWVYHQHFLRKLKAKITRKDQLYPGQWDLSQLSKIQTMWEFDDIYTAPDGGYHDAADYYAKSAAQHVLGAINIPTLIITAQDDLIIPYEIFQQSSLHGNALIELLAPLHGGHCGFFQYPQPHEDPFWAENRLVDWIAHQWNAIGNTQVFT